MDFFYYPDDPAILFLKGSKQAEYNVIHRNELPFVFSEPENVMQLPYSDVLDIAHFSRLFDNKSECYKLFWFQAIARKIKEGYEIITFETLIDEMITDAWYMVSEYHLNLGPNDALEKVVHRLSEISHMKIQ